ncbi:hypothetical protein JTB14_012391 [Gonioctena quinquepunctata]|nr:hypothetical protein JTB14_012391 [Gonioctena quinquepunctata]
MVCCENSADHRDINPNLTPNNNLINASDDRMYLLDNMCDDDKNSKKKLGGYKKKKCNKCEVTKNSNQNIHTTTANTHLEVKDKAGALAVSKVPATETNSRETETKSKQYITRKEVSAAVKEVKTLSVIGNIQNLHKEEIYQRQDQYTNNSSDEWSHVQNKRKRRKFLVGRTEETCVVETIPKVVSLHVTRLHPKTKPIDLKNFLALHIPDVECEPHNSRKPEVYSSMKVTLKTISKTSLAK